MPNQDAAPKPDRPTAMTEMGKTEMGKTENGMTAKIAWAIARPKIAVAAAVAVLAITALTWSGTNSAQAGDPVLVGGDVRAADRVSFDQIDHSVWDALLARHVDERGQVTYGAWKQSGSDVQQLNAYLKTLSAADPGIRSSREATLAFWINAYNAVTVQGILREYPTDSIRNHTAKLFGYNIWDDLQLIVGGKRYSLNQIEHEVLRKMGEPRIHFAIVCASIGCPRLLNQAYTSERLDSQLQINTNDFFANAQNFRFDQASNTIYLSSILDWFGEDFGADRATQLRRIAPWLPSEPAKASAATGRANVSYLSYDWSLNGR